MGPGGVRLYRKARANIALLHVLFTHLYHRKFREAIQLSPPSGSEYKALPLNINISPADLVNLVRNSNLLLNTIGARLIFHDVTT